MVAQEKRPLARIGNGRCPFQYFGDGVPVFLAQGHVDSGHQGEMKGHVAFVAIPEIGGRVLRPLVGLGQQHAVLVVAIHLPPDFLDHGVGLGKVFVVGPFPHAEIGDCVEPEPIDPQVEPEVEHPDDRLHHLGIVEVQVGLMGKKTMPVIGSRHRVPGPVGGFSVGEDDARFRKFGIGIAPDISAAGR